MIIAAYAGAGKSTFAARVPNTVDLPIMPRSWILSPRKSEEEEEKEKGRLDRLPDPLYPYNFIIDILKAERKYKYVLIPTNIRVISMLREEYGRKVVLCYPGDELKEEYRERFIARGNREEFFELFIDGWDNFLEPLREYEDAVHIVMESGAYLTDLKERLDDELLRDDTKPVPEETIAALERELESQRGDCVLRIGRTFCYRIQDILDPNERYFLADLANRATKRDMDTSLRIFSIAIADVLLPPESVMTDDRARVLEYLEQLPMAADD